MKAILFLLLLSQLSFAQVPDWAIEEAQFVNRIGVEEEDYYDISFEFTDRLMDATNPRETYQIMSELISGNDEVEANRRRHEQSSTRRGRISYIGRIFDHGEEIHGINIVLDMFLLNTEARSGRHRNIMFIPFEADIMILRTNPDIQYDIHIINKIKISVFRTFFLKSQLQVDIVGLYMYNINFSNRSDQRYSRANLNIIGLKAQHYQVLSENDDNPDYFRFKFSADLIGPNVPFVDSMTIRNQDVNSGSPELIPEGTLENAILRNGSADDPAYGGIELGMLLQFAFSERFLLDLYADLYIGSTGDIVVAGEVNDELAGRRDLHRASILLANRFGARLHYFPHDNVGVFAEISRSDNFLFVVDRDPINSSYTTVQGGLEFQFATRNNQ